MNTNGFQALYLGKDGYAEIPWTHPAGSRYSIVVRFLSDDLPKDGTLFSLGEDLRVGFTQTGDFAGRIQVSGTGFRFHSERSVLSRVTNTLAAVFTDQDLEIYCNGISVLKKTLPAHLRGASSLRIGENLSAVCVFDVTVFHRILTPLEIQQCCIKKPVNYEKRILFSGDEAPAGVTLHQCRIENCVYTLDCREGGFCLPNVGLPEKYTISLSLYLTDERCQDGILFQSSDFQVKIFYGRGCIAPQLIIHHAGEPEFNVPCSFKREQWINITFAFDGSRCSIYFDGSPAMVFDCHSTQTQADNITFGPFDGYMDICTIVRCAVSKDQMAGFLQNPPGIFHRDLLYLCDFSRREFLESRGSTDLTSHGAKIVLARGTGALTGVKKEIAPPESARPYSDFVNWQIGVLLRILVQWIYQQFGIYPNRGNIDMDKDPWEIEIGLRQFIHKEILSMPEAQDIMIDYDEISQEKMLTLIQAMEKNGTLEKLIAYLYQDNEDYEKLAEFIKALLKAAMIAAILLAIKTMLEDMKPLPKPPESPDQPDVDDDDDDDDDKKKKKTDIRIKQMTLKGDMNILTEGGGNLRMAPDTASAGEKQKIRAVFFLKNRTGNPTFKVTLTLKGGNNDFIVSAGNKYSQVIAGTQQSVSCTGDNSVEVSCPVYPEKFEGKYGKCTETLRWSCRSKDGKQSQLLGETDFELYFLEGKPCGPWKDTVPIECLELCADCAEHAGKNSAGFFTDYIKYISDGLDKQECTADAAQSAYKKSFSRIYPKKDKPSVFKVRAFARACRLGRYNIAYNDMVYAASVFNCLHGNARVSAVGLCSGIEWEEKDQPADGARLLFQKGGRKEGCFCPEGYIHGVLASGENIYDPLLGVEGLPFSERSDCLVTDGYNSNYYREGNYLPGSYCWQAFSLNREDWQLDDSPVEVCGDIGETDADSAQTLSEAPTVGLVGQRGNVYVHTFRTELDPEVGDYIRQQPRENPHFEEVCHSISASQIDNIIADICNAIFQHRHGDASFQTLIEALYPEIPDEEGHFVERRHRFTERLADTLVRRLENGNRDPYTNNLILHFSYLAGNSPANLRMGRGDWNRSIGANFDPHQWFYFLDRDSVLVISDFAFDEECVQGQLMATLERRYPNVADIPPNQPGYYLADINDGIRIAKLREMGYSANMIRKYVMDPGPVFYPLIASSGNRFPHEGGGGIRDRYIDPPRGLPPIPIFYIALDGQDGMVWAQLV